MGYVCVCFFTHEWSSSSWPIASSKWTPQEMTIIMKWSFVLHFGSGIFIVYFALNPWLISVIFFVCLIRSLCLTVYVYMGDISNGVGFHLSWNSRCLNTSNVQAQIFNNVLLFVAILMLSRQQRKWAQLYQPTNQPFKQQKTLQFIHTSHITHSNVYFDAIIFGVGIFAVSH